MIEYSDMKMITMACQNTKQVLRKIFILNFFVYFFFVNLFNLQSLKTGFNYSAEIKLITIFKNWFHVFSFILIKQYW